MDKRKWFTALPFYLLIILYFVLGYSTLAYGDKWASMLYREDHYFENLGAISLFVASAFSFYIFVIAYKNRQVLKFNWIKLAVYLGLAALYFFGAGEEISWGQRIFHIKEPAALAAENAQDELNVHNLAIFEKNELLKGDTIFTFFWIGFTVLIPAASLLWGRFKEWASRFAPIVYWGIGLLFLINYVLAKIAKVVFVSAYSYPVIPFTQAVQEIKESNYELLFIFLSLFVLSDLIHTLNAARQTLELGVTNPAVQKQAE